MEFKFHMTTKVYFGKNCIKDNLDELKKLGRKAIIITGSNSGVKSGALYDIETGLQELGIEYVIFDKVENNPSTDNVLDASLKAREHSVDFVIGVGGGSPLDSAKAVAVLAVNNIQPIELFEGNFPNRPLPIVAIPTTAGTGSEVTQYSILTRKDIKIKRSFASEYIFPVIAFLDPQYTVSQPWEVTVNTAIDALSHAVEGYLSKKGTPVSDLLAEQAFFLFGQCMDNLANKKVDFCIREKLLYMSMLAGMVISQTGTTIIHPMGYILTYFRDVPHGRANAIFMAESLKYLYEFCKEKIDKMLELMSITDLDMFKNKINGLIHDNSSYNLDFDKEELMQHAITAVEQRSMQSSIYKPSLEDVLRIMDCSLIKAKQGAET